MLQRAGATGYRKLLRAAAGLVLALAAPAVVAAADRPPFSVGKVSFSIRFKDEVSPYSVLALLVSGSEKVVFEVTPGQPGQRFGMVFSGGVGQRTGPYSWEWVAPATPGLHPLSVTEIASGETMTLNAFVMVPFSAIKGEYLNGYRMGVYPSTPLRGLAIYQRPAGFIEVSEGMLATPISPHFRLGQFLCKQNGGFPKYLIVRERLLLKLEVLLEEVNRRGYRCDSFHVMSGYRTPYYNRVIRNVKYSRHLWGGAADVFIDEDGDGQMDDLNRDGVIDRRDARILFEIAEGMTGDPWYQRFLGGLGLYEATRDRGPFVHVDARGFRARWGS